MFRFKTSHLALMLGLIAPLGSYAADYCIAVNGGFGNGGTSHIGKNFAPLPAAGTCKPWSGFSKTASSVIVNSTGAGCRSSDGKVLTLTILSTNPSWFGAGMTGSDHIRLCPAGTSGCPVGAGQDVGSFSGPAAPQTCTASLIKLPAVHD